MLGATKRWFHRNRRGLAIGTGVIGAGYMAGQYVVNKIFEARERMSSDRIAREKSVFPLPPLSVWFSVWSGEAGWASRHYTALHYTVLGKETRKANTYTVYVVASNKTKPIARIQCSRCCLPRRMASSRPCQWSN